MTNLMMSQGTIFTFFLNSALVSSGEYFMYASPYFSLGCLFLHDSDIHLECSSWDLILKISESLIITKDNSVQLAYMSISDVL
jgi:hypothetical protein